MTLLPQVILLLVKSVLLSFLCQTEDASEREKRDLLSELALLKNLDPHPHVIQLFGCVSTESKFVDNSFYHRDWLSRKWNASLQFNSKK